MSNILSNLTWTTISQFVKQILQIVTTIVLANFLKIEDFGLLSIAYIFTGFFSLIKDLGTSSAIIQREKLTDELLSSIYWFNNLVALCFVIIFLIFSSYVSSLFNDIHLIKILQILSLTFLLNSIGSVHQAILERKLQFGKIAIVELVAAILSSMAAIATAISGLQYWSLVIQGITSSLTMMVMILWISEWRPLLCFRTKDLESIARFSFSLTGFNIFNYFVRNADYFLIGKYLGVSELGIYTLAYKIILYPLQNITYIVSRVMFPVYSKIQQRNLFLKKLYTKLALTIAYITFPMMFLVFSLSDWVIPLLFGPKWDGAIILLIILAPIGMLQSIDSTTGSIYQAKGRTDIMLLWGIFSGLIFVVGFILGLSYGAKGVAISYLIANLILFVPSFIIPFRLISYSFLDFVKKFRYILFMCLCIFILTLLLKTIFESSLYVYINRYIYFIFIILAAIALYFLLSRLLYREIITEFLRCFRKNIKAKVISL